MARIRTVKPELLTHEGLFELERKTGLPMRIAFVGLFTICDREGRFKWRPRAIKLAVLPYDACEFDSVLDALHACGMVRKYIVDGEEYGVIPTFLKHQVINNRESESALPVPGEDNYIRADQRVPDAWPTRDSHVGHAPLGEGKGREGKGIGKEEERNAPVVAVVVERRSENIEVIEAQAPLVLVAEQVSKKRGDAGEDVRAVFTYWQQAMTHPQAKLDAKREKAIKARLKDGYEVGQLCKAVDGCKLSPHHMGQNDNRTVYDDIALICRDGPQVDGFIKRSSAAPSNGRSNNQQQTLDNLRDWLKDVI